MGVTRIHPKATGGTPPYSGPTSSWTEQYLVDWSAEASRDWIASPAMAVIQGSSWEPTTTTAGSTCSIVPGSGLVMAPDPAVNSTMPGAPNFPPRTYSKLTDLAPLTGLYSSIGDLQAVCFQALISGNVTQDNNGYGLLVARGGMHMTMERLYNSSVHPGATPTGYRTSWWDGATMSQINSASIAPSYELFELVMFPGGGWVASIRDESGFVDPLGSYVFRTQMTTNSYTGIDPTQNSWTNEMTYPQFLVYNGSLTTHSATMTKFRVLSLGAT